MTLLQAGTIIRVPHKCEMPSVDWFDAVCLAAAVLDMPEPEDDDNVDAVEEKLIDSYGIDLDQFSRLTGNLLPMCSSDVSPLTQQVRRGFAKDGAYIVKTCALDFGNIKISDLINVE